MKLPVITTLLQLFAPSPDLCAEPYLDITGTPCTDSMPTSCAAASPRAA